MQSESHRRCAYSRMRRIRGSLFVFLVGGPGYWLYRFLLGRDHFVDDWQRIGPISLVIALLVAIAVYIWR